MLSDGRPVLSVLTVLGPGHIVLVGDKAPPKGAQPQFSTHVDCGQTAGWIKMILGRDVGVGLCDIVLDGIQFAPKRGTTPNFPPMSIRAKRLYASGSQFVRR